MFDLNEIELFGNPAVRISNGEGNAMTIIPSAGAHLQSLVLNGIETLDGFQSRVELEENAWGKSGLLFPFPNRLRNGKYAFNGREYHFPINDAQHQNALHGFGMQRTFQVKDVVLSESEAKVILSNYYDKEFDYYPWKIETEVIYCLLNSSKLEFQMKIINHSDEAIPVGMGWHPYFCLQQEPEQVQLKLPALEQVVVDTRMIPTGNRTAMQDFQTPTPINKYKFDTGFALQSDQDATVELKYLNGKKLIYSQDSTPRSFNYLQVFIPPGRNAIALEPMTCNIDAFNNGEGLLKLQAGEDCIGRASIRVE